MNWSSLISLFAASKCHSKHCCFHSHLSTFVCSGCSVSENSLCAALVRGKKDEGRPLNRLKKTAWKAAMTLFFIWCLWTHNPELYQILLKSNYISSVRTGSPLRSYVVARQAAPPSFVTGGGSVGKRGRRWGHSFNFTFACRRNLVILWLPKLFSTWVFYFLVPEGCWHTGQPSLFIILTWNGKSVCGCFHSWWFTLVLLSASTLCSLFGHTFISCLYGLLFSWDFSVHSSFPCLLPILHSLKSLWASFSPWSPGPCPAPFVHTLLHAWLPAFLLPGLLHALLVPPALLLSSSRSLFMYLRAQSVQRTTGRQAELVPSHCCRQIIS